MKLQVAFKILVLVTVVFSITGEAVGMDANDVVRLKEAGVGDAVIEALVREKSLETAAFTVDEIVKMTKAGVGDGTMVKMIEEKSFIRGEKEVTYGKDMRPATRATVSDIMELKKAGISDEVIEREATGFKAGQSTGFECHLEFLLRHPEDDEELCMLLLELRFHFVLGDGGITSVELLNDEGSGRCQFKGFIFDS